MAHIILSFELFSSLFCNEKVGQYTIIITQSSTVGKRDEEYWWISVSPSQTFEFRSGLQMAPVNVNGCNPSNLAFHTVFRGLIAAAMFGLPIKRKPD